MDVEKAGKDTEKNVRRKSLRCGNKATKRIRIIERKIGYAELFLPKGGIYLHMSKKSCIFALALIE